MSKYPKGILRIYAGAYDISTSKGEIACSELQRKSVLKIDSKYANELKRLCFASGPNVTTNPNHQQIISMDKITKYFRDTAAELKQVSWPTQHQALLYTALVIGISAFVALYVGLLDKVFSQIISLFV
jgi:preprotein translocase subunit SecE